MLGIIITLIGGMLPTLSWRSGSIVMLSILAIKTSQQLPIPYPLCHPSSKPTPIFPNKSTTSNIPKDRIHKKDCLFPMKIKSKQKITK